MQSFSFNDAIRFKLATQNEDTGAKLQVFLGVLLGVLLRWLYGIIVDVIKGNPWNFGNWSTIIARLEPEAKVPSSCDKQQAQAESGAERCRANTHDPFSERPRRVH